MSEILKPCPFCGGSNLEVVSTPQGCFVGCSCGCFTGDFETEAEAIDAWNTRIERTSHKVRAWEDSPLGEGYGGYVLICSECGEWIANDGEDGPDDGPNYCFNCGAKMEKRRAVDEQV